MSSVKQRFIFCKECNELIRIDDGSLCIHYKAPQRNSESTLVVFRSADGRISVPWSPDAKCPDGFVREEVRGAKAVRRLEREMDQRDIRQHRQHQEKLARFMEPINNSIREGLKNQIRNARHPFAKALAQAALDRQQRGYSDNYDPGNHRDS